MVGNHQLELKAERIKCGCHLSCFWIGLNVPGEFKLSSRPSLGKRSFHPVPVGVAGIVGAKGIYFAIRCGIMNRTPPYPLKVIIVIVHKMHAEENNRLIGMAFVFV